MAYTPEDLKPYFSASDPQSIDIDTIAAAATAVFGAAVQRKGKDYVQLTVGDEGTFITATYAGFAFAGTNGLFRGASRDDNDEYVWQLRMGLLETLGILDPEF